MGRLAAEAATKGSYDETIVLARWAAAIDDLVRPSSNPAEPFPASSSPLKGGARAGQERLAKRLRRPGRAGHRSRGRVENHSDYPRFERRGSDLIKIGWSKRDKREYEQKAPKTVIDRLARELGRRAGSAAPIATDDLLPAIGMVDGRDVPTYQVYVALAWFRTRGVVEAVGRQGYRILAKDIMREIEPIWGAL